MSDIIRLLPDHVANQIAAGEVIQRPASAVKELLENAIDAGATQIKLYLKDAGRTLVQVVDNGIGMSPLMHAWPLSAMRPQKYVRPTIFLHFIPRASVGRLWLPLPR